MNTTSTTEIQDQSKSTKELAIELLKSIRWPAVLLIAILSFRGEISNLINTKSASLETKESKTVSIGTHNVCVVVSGTTPQTIVNGKTSDVNTHVMASTPIADIEAISKQVQDFKKKGWSTNIKTVNCQHLSEL